MGSCKAVPTEGKYAWIIGITRAYCHRGGIKVLALGDLAADWFATI